MRTLALREARHEYAEYYFLFPLFLSITLLTKAGFFDQLQSLIQQGIANSWPRPCGVCAISGMHLPLGDPRQQCRGRLRVARPARFGYCNPASVCHGADRGLRLRRLLDAYRLAPNRLSPLRSFSAMWTSTTRRSRWIKEMTPVIIEILVLLTVIIYLESFLLHWLD